MREVPPLALGRVHQSHSDARYGAIGRRHDQLSSDEARVTSIGACADLVSTLISRRVRAALGIGQGRPREFASYRRRVMVSWSEP